VSTDDSFDDPFALIAFGICVFLIGTGASLAIVFALGIPYEFENACSELGGHIEHGYRTALCLSPDGRVLDVQ
jgi:hypothetical protein